MDTIARALPTGGSEAGEELRPQEESGWNGRSVPGKLSGGYGPRLVHRRAPASSRDGGSAYLWGSANKS